jgi:predicted membrane protein
MPTRLWIDGAARGVSALLALAVFGVTGLAPFAFGTEVTGRMHGALGLMLMGASAAAVHAFGFKPTAWWWRALFSAPTAWVLIAAGAAMLVGGR